MHYLPITSKMQERWCIEPSSPSEGPRALARERQLADRLQTSRASLLFKAVVDADRSPDLALRVTVKLMRHKLGLLSGQVPNLLPGSVCPVPTHDITSTSYSVRFSRKGPAVLRLRSSSSRGASEHVVANNIPIRRTIQDNRSRNSTGLCPVCYAVTMGARRNLNTADSCLCRTLRTTHLHLGLGWVTDHVLVEYQTSLQRLLQMNQSRTPLSSFSTLIDDRLLSEPITGLVSAGAASASGPSCSACLSQCLQSSVELPSALEQLQDHCGSLRPAAGPARLQPLLRGYCRHPGPSGCN